MDKHGNLDGFITLPYNGRVHINNLNLVTPGVLSRAADIIDAGLEIDDIEDGDWFSVDVNGYLWDVNVHFYQFMWRASFYQVNRVGNSKFLKNGVCVVSIPLGDADDDVGGVSLTTGEYIY
jgi:hypothetical protein